MIFDTISKVFRINTLNLYNMTLSGLHKINVVQKNNEEHQNFALKEKNEQSENFYKFFIFKFLKRWN